VAAYFKNIKGIEMKKSQLITGRNQQQVVITIIY